ncbi:MAG TPA: phage holin family protein [Pseudonocardiaceae bacterium]|jgi:hypothetical protein|nr:phage holin family protein [Pseudonocardiaceae bacterium]
MSHSISRTTATTAIASARPDLADTSVGELIGDVTRDLSTLIRQEFELATAELKQELIHSGKAAGTLGGAAFAGQMMLLFASLALWLTLARAIDWRWAALAVAALWALATAGLYLIGRDQLRRVQAPQRTIETLQEIPHTLGAR